MCPSFHFSAPKFRLLHQYPYRRDICDFSVLRKHLERHSEATFTTPYVVPCRHLTDFALFVPTTVMFLVAR